MSRSFLIVLPLVQFVHAHAVAPVGAQSAGATVIAVGGRGADSVLTASAASGFTGVALIVRDGQLVLRKGYGMANVADRVPFEPTTVVQIGSNTKDFTAVAILQLLERGKLALDDPIAKFLPGVPDDKRVITIRHLLDHRAGFPLGYGGDFEPVTRDSIIARAMRATLEARPGERERYSNVGFSLLAAIIEIISGQSYDLYLRQNILDPLGLHDTGFLLPGFAARRLAHGYSGGRDQGTMLDRPHASDGPYWNLRGNGGMLSTVDDMLAFYHALYGSEKLLKRATREMRFPDEPVVLAGSDLVNFFLYHREPREGLEIILASTTAEARGPAIEARLMPLFGFGGGPASGGRGGRGGGRGVEISVAAKPIMLPTSILGTIATEYLKQFNDGDSTSRVRYFTERFITLPNPQVTPADRVARTTQMRAQLGRFTPTAFREISPTRAELDVLSDNGDAATLVFDVEADAPHRIRSIQIRVG